MKTSPVLAAVTVKVTFNVAERMYVEHLAQLAGMSLQDYLRSQVGLRRRPMGRPSPNEVVKVEDEARNLLQEIGVDPTLYFPPAPVQPPSEDEESPAQREAINAKVRAFLAGVGPSAC
jgi:hypothetical protein